MIEEIQYLSLLKENVLFANIPESKLKEIAACGKEKAYQFGEYILKEGTIGDKFYFILQGKIEILKNTGDDNPIDAHLTVLSEGEHFGEMALLNQTARIASARTLSNTARVLCFSANSLRKLSTHTLEYQKILEKLQSLEEDLKSPPVYATLTMNLAKDLSQRLFSSNLITIQALQEGLKLTQLRLSMGRFLISIVTGLAIYVYSMALVQELRVFFTDSSMVSDPLILLFVIAVFHFMKISGYSREFFGLSSFRWKRYFIEGVLFSLPLIAIIIFSKWIAILSIYPEIALFDGRIFSTPGARRSSVETLIFMATYLLFVPAQELIARGAIQGSLQQFLADKHSRLKSIIISNLLFSLVHLHLSFQIAICVFFAGLFWGWLYSRQKTLVGVSVSHSIIGIFIFYVLNVDFLFEKGF